MKRMLNNIGLIEKEIPGASQVILAIIAMTNAGLPVTKESVSKYAAPDKAAAVIAKLLANDMLTPKVVGKAMQYEIRMFDEFSCLNLPAAERHDILAILRGMFPDDTKFDLEVAELEMLMRRFKEIKTGAMLKAVIQNAANLKVKSLKQLTKNDIHLFLFSAKEEVTVAADQVDKQLARMIYRIANEPKRKHGILRAGLKSSDIAEFINKSNPGITYSMPAVISELRSMPIKFKITE